jgi:hypothetical protein
MRNRQHSHSQGVPSEICLLCWQSHPAEICSLKGKECFVLHFGAQKDGKEPTSQREAQACYRSVRGKLKTSPLQVLLHQLYQQGHWYVVVIWKQEDATDPLIKELGLALWLYQTEIPLAALPVEILRELSARFEGGERIGVLNVDHAPAVGEATERALAAFKRATQGDTSHAPQPGVHLQQKQREWVL